MTHLQLWIVKENFKFVKIDITDADAIDALFNEYRFDWVVNFAAESHVDRSIVDPSIFLKTNILGVQVLMDACRKYEVKRFHQVSTDEVYGDLPLDRKDLFYWLVHMRELMDCQYLFLDAPITMAHINFQKR